MSEKNYDSTEKASNLASLYGDDSGVPAKRIDAKSDITVPRQIDIYSKIDVTVKDRYVVTFGENVLPGSINPVVVLQNTQKKECGHFKLVFSEQAGVFYLTAKYSSFLFENKNNIDYELVFQPCRTGSLELIKPIKIYCHETETTDEVLCIDFGTSNTAVGANLRHDYISNLCNSAVTNGTVNPGNENIVSFDTNGCGYKYADIVPTIISCEDCSNNKKIKYRFGYSAYEELKKAGFCPDETVFLEIKRWATDCEKNVKLIDSKGNIAEIKRKEIIREYLVYVINEAQQQFKCFFKNLHITAPVKLKSEYLRVFADILPEYHIERDNAIDEGVAVLYSEIDEDITRVVKDDTQAISRKALIIDCGGGTSDLASCSYKVSYDDDIIDVAIDTAYLNGDYNFGGNNLTYRIMQYMKIVYAHYYCCSGKSKKAKRLLLESLLDDNAINMVSRIENCNDDAETASIYHKIYEKFENAYEEAEAVIPTKFSRYETESEEVYTCVRNNFYFLWNLADQMKKQFYQYDTISRYTISKDESDKDSDLYINPINSWKLTVFRNGAYISEDYPDITFNAKEIAWLMTGDIYYLVHRFLNGLYEDESLNDFNAIKLSGQSTNIDTFKNGLKEFLPGKKIKINPDPTENPYELKLICLRGALKYIKALHSADIDVNLNNAINSIPFDLITKGKQDDKLMISVAAGWEQSPNKVRIVTTATYKEFYFRGNDNHLLDRPFRMDCTNLDKKLRKKTVKDIVDMSLGQIDQEFLDQLKKDNYYIVTYLNKVDWGFNAVIIHVDNKGEYTITEPEFCSFQSEVYQRTFFDGDC